MTDHGIPLILCTIDEAARARQWDRVGAVLAVPKMSEAQMFAAVHMKAP